MRQPRDLPERAKIQDQLLGAPAWDPDFNTADLPLMMQAARLPQRNRRHFLAA